MSSCGSADQMSLAGPAVNTQTIVCHIKESLDRARTLSPLEAAVPVSWCQRGGRSREHPPPSSVEPALGLCQLVTPAGRPSAERGLHGYFPAAL